MDITGKLAIVTEAAMVSWGDAESFLVLPHPEVETYFKAKANDYGRWIGAMQKMRAKMATHSSSRKNF